MFSFSAVIVIFLILGALYYFAMKLYDLKRKEVAEKLEEIQEIDELSDDIKKIDINKIKGKKGKINEFRNI